MYFAARDQVFSILQDRKESVWSRLEQLLCYTELLQEMLDGGMSDEMENQYVVNQSRPMPEQKAAIYYGILALCRELEAMDESWPQTLEELQQLISHPEQFAATEAAMLASCREREYEYEQLAVYFIYRYFMKCREDEDVRSKGRLTVFCILLIRLLDTACFARTGSITTEDRVLHAKCCSKEIEYSEENLETLADAFWERDEVSLEKLCMLSNTGYCKK